MPPLLAPSNEPVRRFAALPPVERKAAVIKELGADPTREPVPTAKLVAQVYAETARHMRAAGKATEAADLLAKAALLTKPAR